MFEKGVSEVTD